MANVCFSVEPSENVTLFVFRTAHISGFMYFKLKQYSNQCNKLSSSLRDKQTDKQQDNNSILCQDVARKVAKHISKEIVETKLCL